MNRNERRAATQNKREELIKEFNEFIKEAYKTIFDKIKENTKTKNPDGTFNYLADNYINARIGIDGVIRLGVARYFDSRKHKPQDNTLIRQAINIWTERSGEYINKIKKERPVSNAEIGNK